MTTGIDWKAVAKYEHDSIEAICKHFFPQGKKKAGEWRLGDTSGAAGDSLGVQLAGDKAGCWIDRATNEGGRIRNLIASNRGISDQDAVEEIERAFGVRLRENGSNGTFDWNACVMAMAAERKILRELEAWRGLSDEFCSWLVARKLLGLYNGSIAFPIHDQAGNVSWLHYLANLEEKRWLCSKGAVVSPLVIGNLKEAAEVHIHESTWDGLAFADRSGAYLSPNVAVVITRGVDHAKKVQGVIPAGKRIYVWPQNDKLNPKTGKVPSEDWFNAIKQNLEGPFFRVQTPPEYEDLNAWTLAGATKADLVDAVTAATEDPEKGESTGEDQLFEELLAKYQAAICTSDHLANVKIPKRKFLIGRWMKEGDLGFIYGERGSGKTWLVDAIATHVSIGKNLQTWGVPEAANVLYLDGEMAFDDAKSRILGMDKGNPRLHILHHENLFNQCGLAMNLTNPRTQQVLTKVCENLVIKLLLLDNLSCLFSGMKENDSDEWEKVLNWLLDLRRRGIAVLIVHHAGRSGFMRGTSKREDAAFWIIRVDEVQGRGENETGARFQTNFDKQRNSDVREWTREWTFQTESDGQVSIGCTEISFDSKVLQLIQDGLTGASDIADELKVAKSTVSKAAKRLEDQKLIETRGRQYKPRGFMKE